MPISYKIKTPPTLKPVDLAYVKEHSKIDYTDEDTVLQGYLDAAIAYAEKYMGRGIMSQTVTQTFNAWPASGCYLELALSPLFGATPINHIKYYDTDEAQQTLAITVYGVTAVNEPPLIFLKKDQSWPSLASRPEAIEVEFTAGYADAASVPATIKQAICLLFAYFEAGREDSVKQKKTSAENLLDKDWVGSY